MQRVCASCFLKPAPARGTARGEVAGMIICSDAGVGRAPAASTASGIEPLRCDYCNREVRLDSRQLAWYA